MQLILILGIVFAIGAVAFALQNNVPVTVSFVFWSFDSSLAIVLLLALGIGALIAGLLSSPTVIRHQWIAKRLRRQVGGLEAEKAALLQRVREQDRQLARFDQDAAPAADAEAPRPYVGFTALLGGDAADRERKG